MTRPAPFPKPLRISWLLQIGLSILCLLITLPPWHVILHTTWAVPQHRVVAFACDLMTFRDRLPYFGHPEFYGPSDTPFVYPASMALVYKFFFNWKRHIDAPLFLFLAGAVSYYLAANLRRAIVRQGTNSRQAFYWIASSLCLSYPIWLVVFLCNTELIVACVLGIAAVCYIRDRTYVAAGLVGVAIALKIYPLILLGIFFSQRQYKQLAVSVAAAFGINLFALWLVTGSIATSQRGVTAGLAWFRQIYVLTYHLRETGFDHSIFGFIKRLIYIFSHRDVLPSAASTAYLAAAAVFGLLLYWFKIRRLPILNQVLALFIAAVLLPPTSHDYTLIELYIPWALLVVYAFRMRALQLPTPGLLPIFIGFAVCFSPLNEFTPSEVDNLAQIRTIALVVMMVYCLRYRFEVPTQADETVGSLEARNPLLRSIPRDASSLGSGVAKGTLEFTERGKSLVSFGYDGIVAGPRCAE